MKKVVAVWIHADSADTRDNLTKLLGFESDLEIVGTAGGGNEAIALAKKERPDAILMDINWLEPTYYDATTEPQVAQNLALFLSGLTAPPAPPTPGQAQARPSTRAAGKFPPRSAAVGTVVLNGVPVRNRKPS